MKHLPLDNIYVTSVYGERNFMGYTFHNGVDLRAKEGTKVYAIDDGKVVVCKYSSSYGNYIVIEHDGYCSLYAHASKLNVELNDNVVSGQIIMQAGSTGQSTASHLHFEIRKCKYGTIFWTKNGDKSTYAIDPMIEINKLQNEHWAKKYLDALVELNIIETPEVWTAFDEYPTQGKLLAIIYKLYKKLSS